MSKGRFGAPFENQIGLIHELWVPGPQKYATYLLILGCYLGFKVLGNKNHKALSNRPPGRGEDDTRT